MLLAQRDQIPGEFGELLLPVGVLPVEPRKVTVLAIAVVIPVLGTGELVAPEDHWRTLRQQQSREKIAKLTAPERIHTLVIGGTFGATVPRTVIVMPVHVAFAV